MQSKQKKIKHEYEYLINTCHVTNIIPASLIFLVKFRSVLPYSKAIRYRHTTQRHIQRKTKELTESQPQKH